MGGAISTRAYCNDGRVSQMLNINGTYFVICVPQSQVHQNSEPLSPETSLAVGLGIGIPILVLMICLIVANIYKYNEHQKHNRSLYRNANNAILPEQIHIEMPVEVAERELTAEALNDFRAGNLSMKLMEELMILRVNKGQDLTSYVRYADRCHQPHIADWIYRLNPGDIPREIREKAYRQAHPQT